MERLIRKLMLFSFCSLLAAVLSVPFTVMAEHNPLIKAQWEQQRHQQLSALSQFDSGHHHENGDQHEHSPLHEHGHNPADHLHESGHPLPQYAIIAVPEHPARIDYSQYYLSLVQPPPTQPPQV